VGDTGRRIKHELGYRTLRAFLAAARPFPLAALRAGGVALGLAAFAVSRRERRRAHEHLQLAFPDRSETWRGEVVAGCARSLGRLLGEVAWLWSASAQDILARTELVGLDNLTGCLAPRRGAIFVTGHIGNWEWLGAAAGAAGVPMIAAARELDDSRIEEIAEHLRSRFGGGNVVRGEGAGQRLASALRQGRPVGLLIDQDIDAPGAFVEYFGRPAWTPTGAAVLALRLRVPIVTGFLTRLDDGRMRIVFDPPIEARRGDDLAADAARLTALLTARIEAQVRAHPEQWVWMHRRWRRQPGPDDRVWTAADRPAG
jgi:Kdo2-lipid IVA lauroyltransferase/acyltransferase